MEIRRAARSSLISNTAPGYGSAPYGSGAQNGGYGAGAQMGGYNNNMGGQAYGGGQMGPNGPQMGPNGPSDGPAKWPAGSALLRQWSGGRPAGSALLWTDASPSAQ